MDHQQTFEKRSKAKISETKCEQHLISKNIQFKKFGWDYNVDHIPGYNFIKLPEYMRALPDYVIFNKTASFVEVKGCKEFLRLKICDMNSYTFWIMVMNLYFFIYSTMTNKVYKLTYKDMNDITKHCSIEIYKDNKKHYYRVELEQLQKKQRG